MTVFTEQTIESAPPASRRFMTATANSLGYLPSAIARWAASPQLLEAFAKLTTLFDATALDPLARETVVMTIAVRNRCDVCIAMHTARLVMLAADEATISALRDGTPLSDPRLEAVRVFTLRVLHTAGDVGDDGMNEFLGHGFTAQNALEVILGVGTYTMSTLANRLTGAAVDEPIRRFAAPRPGHG